MSSRYPLSTKDSKLDASVLDLAYLYAAYAKDRVQGTDDAPTFADAVRMHRLIDLIEEGKGAAHCVPAFTDPRSPSAAGVLELARNAKVVVVSPAKCCAQLPDEFLAVPKLHRVPPFAYDLTGSASTSAAYWRSNALAAPLHQLSAMDSDMGSGKM